MKFSSYHPGINLIYFVFGIVCGIIFNTPVFMGISFVCAFLYNAKLNKKKGIIFNICMIAAGVLFALFYSSYNHFGNTNLGENFIGNKITLESLLCGASIGIRIMAVCMLLCCFFTVFSSDKLVYVIGRISPRASLFAAVLLRMFPKIRRKFCEINDSRKGFGRGIKNANFFLSVKYFFEVLSILLTYIFEWVAQMSDSMQSRGYGLKGRTAFSLYRFDYRDRSVVLAMFLLVMLTVVGAMFNQTNMLYNPEIIITPQTAASYVFYVAYGIFLALPLILEFYGEMMFNKRIKNILEK